jgi:phosphate transport system substrate-binding protein
MEPTAMNDDFLRRLRPMPRAAFVHELKARLDRQASEDSFAGRGPAYLRTLLIALLIGGAAFAVTMLATRHASREAPMNASVSEGPRRLESARHIASSPLETSKNGEVTPAITRGDRDAAPLGAEARSASQEGGARATSAAGAARAAPGEASAPLPAVLAIPQSAVRWIEGAGGAFPAPLYAAWNLEYRLSGGASVEYQATGSGGGLKLLASGRVAFAAVDAPLEASDMASSGLFQFPVAAGGVMPIARVDGVETGRITLDGPTLAGIYLGEITRWNDGSIAKLNPGLTLPDTRITLVYQLDASPWTLLFTYYLSRVDDRFKAGTGAKAQLDLSPGAAVRGEGGMADLVQRTNGAIGYIDYIYARQRGIESIRLFNRDGNAVRATPETLQSAVTHAAWGTTTGVGPSLVNLPGEKTWPITTASFAVMQSRTNRIPTLAAVRFFDWAYRDGSQTAAKLGYVPIPPVVANQVRETWAATLARPVPPAADSDRNK